MVGRKYSFISLGLIQSDDGSLVVATNAAGIKFHP